LLLVDFVVDTTLDVLAFVTVDDDEAVAVDSTFDVLAFVTVDDDDDDEAVAVDSVFIFFPFVSSSVSGVFRLFEPFFSD